MAKEGVNIPVRVTGAEEAQEGLRATGEAISGVGQAGQQAAAGLRQFGQAGQDVDLARFRAWRAEQGRPFSAADIQLQTSTSDIQLEPLAQDAAKAAEATKAAGGEVEKLNTAGKLFSLEGGRAFRGVLSAINPELGMAFGLAANLGQSLAGLSVTMLGFAGAAAVIAGLVALYQAWAEGAERTADALERIRKFQDEARTHGAQARRDIVQEGAAIGAFMPNAAEIQAQVAAMQKERGVPPELGRNVALAEQFARDRGVRFDPETYLRGLIVRGAKPETLGPGQPEAEKAIAAVQRAGETPGAPKMLESYLYQVGQEQKGGAPSPAELVREALDAALKQIATEQQGRLTEKELAAIGPVAREVLGEVLPELEAMPPKWRDRNRRQAYVIEAQRRGLLPWRGGDWTEKGVVHPADLGGVATQEELIDLGFEARLRAEQIGHQGPVGREFPTTQPVTITYNISIDQVQSVPGGLRSGLVSSLEGLPGGGIED